MRDSNAALLLKAFHPKMQDGVDMGKRRAML
jgi:hypothetical protein